MKKKPQELPFHLSHKPLFAIEYAPFDEYTNKHGDTDAEFISVGIPAFNDSEPSSSQDNQHQVSTVKIFRHSGNRWSRQSEEVPSARLVDATIVLAYSFDPKISAIPAGTFVAQEEDLPIEDRRDHEPRYLGEYKKRVKRRLNMLREVLNDLADKKII